MARVFKRIYPIKIRNIGYCTINRTTSYTIGVNLIYNINYNLIILGLSHTSLRLYSGKASVAAKQDVARWRMPHYRKY